MSTTYKVHNGTVLSNVLQTLLTFGASLIAGGGKLVNINITTDGATARTVEVHLVPSGQTVTGIQYLIYKGPSLPNDTFPIPGGPFFAGSGDFIQAKVDTGTDVAVRVTAFEETP